jgi:formate/nitrite transporter FocA (FNT family)
MSEILRTDYSDDTQVRRRIAPRAAIVFEAIRREGEEELERATPGLTWSGLAAGLSMGFSFVAEALLHAHLPDAPWRPLITKLGYSVGFLIVVLGRQQLFTENTLTPILDLLHRCTTAKILQVARLWAIVLAANLVGGFIFAAGLQYTPVFHGEMQETLTDIGLKTLSGSFWTTFFGAILAGWLIALMVWLLPFAETARVGIILIITYLVGLGGFAHVIAGSIEVIYVVLGGAATWGQFIGAYFIPTLIGNTLGGVTLVAAVNYAQVASDHYVQETQNS